MTFVSNPKRKSYVLNPRGTALYEDTNRFGTKMLEKMGWSKGKGLGADLNGQQDFVKVSYKLDQKGLGFTDRDDQWTQHEDQFNHLLKSFDDNSGNKSNSNSGGENNDNTTMETQQDTGTRTSGLSLEELSKKSRARVHYKKFTRGKDMSRYNEKDLANIFGRRTLDEKLSTEQNEDLELDPKNVTDDGKNVPNFGITTIETGISVNEYFKNKLSKLRGDCVDLNEKLVEENDFTRKKSKKSKQKEEVIADTILSVEKKKKKRKEETKNPVDEHEVEVKKKKKKNKCKDLPVEAFPNTVNKKEEELMEKVDSDETIFPIEQTTKKRKNKTEISVEEEVIEKKKKKKDKCKDSPIEEPLNQEVFIEEEIPHEKNAKKRKRKDKNQLADESLPKKSNTSELEVSKLVESLVYNISTRNPSSSDNVNDNDKQSITDNMLQNIFTLNTFKLEIFKFLDLDGFNKSTLTNISGYGYGTDLKLNVIETLKDLNRINNFYDEALVQKYGKNVIKTKRKEKYNVNKLQKKNIFKGIL